MGEKEYAVSALVTPAMDEHSIYGSPHTTRVSIQYSCSYRILTHFDNINGGKVPGSLQIRRIAVVVKTVAHDAQNLIFTSRPRAPEALEPADEFGDLRTAQIG